MTKNQKSIVVFCMAFAASVLLCVAIALGLAIYVNPWIAVLFVAAVSFASAPTFEMCFFAAIATIMAAIGAWLSHRGVVIACVGLAGIATGLLIVFRPEFDKFLTWLDPPQDEPPKNN